MCSSQQREGEQKPQQLLTCQSDEHDTNPHVIIADAESTTRRTVRFDTAPPTIVAEVAALRDLDEDQKRSLWWSLSDYEVFSDTARNICKEVRRCPSLTSGLDEALRKAVRNSKQTEYDGKLQLVPHDQGLTHWCTHAHSRRGLERLASSFHCKSRNAGVVLTKSSVLNLSLCGDELAKEASRLSLHSRIFARMMGEADAAALLRHSELRRCSGDHIYRVRAQALHRSSSLPSQGLVRKTL